MHPLIIVNRAGALLQEPVLSSLDSGTSKFATSVQNLFQTYIDSVITDTTWACATKRFALTADTTSPGYGFTYQFSLPSDLLRFRYLVDSNGDPVKDGYQVCGDKLFANVKSLCLYYVYRVSKNDTINLRDYVCTVIANYIASQLCMQVTGDSTRAQVLDQQYRDSLALAKTYNAQEAPFLQLSSDTYIQAHNNQIIPY